MKKYLLAALLLAGLNAKAQDFNPKKQGLIFRTDSLDVVSFLEKYHTYKDSVNVLTPYIPFIIWEIDNKHIYWTKENGYRKKYGTVVRVETQPVPQLGAINYTYVLKDREISIIYDTNKKEWVMLSIEKVEGEYMKHFSVRWGGEFDK